LEAPDRRIELIRSRLEAYYDIESRGPGKVSWRTISDEIDEIAGVKMDHESLRQFVRRTMRRGRARVPETEHLEAIVNFLCHPEIDMLSRDELENRDVPQVLARFLLDFLRSKQENEPLPLPTALIGSYRALDGDLRLPDRVIDLSLGIEDGSDVIRLSEIATAYSYDLLTTGGVYKSEITQRLESDGWAILTPEDNLIIFMKQKRYGRNHYYLTLGMDRNVSAGVPVDLLLLLRHQYPLQQLTIPNSFREISKESDGETNLMYFRRLPEEEIDSSSKVRYGTVRV
jgi:hypothetical protein